MTLLPQQRISSSQATSSWMHQTPRVVYFNFALQVPRHLDRILQSAAPVFSRMGRPKKAAAAVKTRGQNTLSFTGKITKPSAAISKVGKPVDQKPAKKQDVVEIATDSRASTPASVEAPSEQPADQKLALRQQPPAAPEEPSKALSVEEEEALNLTDARIRKYWKAKEDQRLHPRGKAAYLVQQSSTKAALRP